MDAPFAHDGGVARWRSDAVLWHQATQVTAPSTPRRAALPDLARNTLGVIFIGALLGGSLWILRPFVAAFIWAVMIVVATWPILCRVQSLLWGRRGLAVVAMCGALLAILIVPILVAVDALLSHAHRVPALVEWLQHAELPHAPSWVEAVPLVGEPVASAWNQVVAAGAEDLVEKVSPYLRSSVAWVAHQAGDFALLLVQLVLVVLLSAVLYSGGEAWARWTRRFGMRLAGAQGDRMVVLAGQAIRGVALGVVVTALVQSTLGGLGFLIAGVPFAAILTAIMFVLGIAQVGPIVVLLGGTAWVYFNVGAGWAVVMLVWSLFVGFMDNVLRPILIRQGADLPMLLIVGGVVGGLVAVGVIGIFVGPVVLAVAYTLLDDWVSSGPEPRDDLG